MAWRGLHLSQNSRLSLADGQMVIQQADAPIRLPLEDLAWVVIDTPQVSLTSALLSACMEQGLVLICTDPCHMPNGIMLPFHSHHRQADVAQQQVTMGEVLKKRLWQRIIQQKILNQAMILQILNRPNRPPLAEMARMVRSGDPDNVEARAARDYWRCLMDDFRRDDDGDRRNGMLNYVYAIVRSVIARSVVASGLLPAFGLHHASVSNAFNLVDDLLEPFRPVADWHAHSHPQHADGPLTLEDRQAMVGILQCNCRMGAEVVTLPVAVDMMIASLLRCIRANDASQLLMPDVHR